MLNAYQKYNPEKTNKYTPFKKQNNKSLNS